VSRSGTAQAQRPWQPEGCSGQGSRGARTLR
jgi:hypothetical protein